jgi:type VI protein secretion system component VasK
MLFAADYPFLNVFWTMILFFFWVAWIWVLVIIIGDLFRRHDTSGWVKALWLIFLILIPFLGVLIYLIANSTGMSERAAAQAEANKAQFDNYVQTVAAQQGTGTAGEIEKAKALLDSGAITQAEFDALKAKALA